jgi:hypothetical protein
MKSHKLLLSFINALTPSLVHIFLETGYTISEQPLIETTLIKRNHLK